MSHNANKHIEYTHQLLNKDKNALFEEYRKARNRWLFINAWDNALSGANYQKKEWQSLERTLSQMNLID